MKRLVSIVIFAVILVALAVVIRFVYVIADDSSQLWAEIPSLISSIAAIVASITAWLALRSLNMTEEALTLTRSTIRPYLALQPGEVSPKHGKNTISLAFQVKNTGSVPANLVAADIVYFGDDEVIEEDNQSKHYKKEEEKPKEAVIFPGAVYNLEHIFDMRNVIEKKVIDDMTLGKVKLRCRLKYGAKEMEYITVQTERLERVERGGLRRIPIQPQRWT